MGNQLLESILKNFSPPRIIACSKTGFTQSMIKTAVNFNVVGFEVRADYFLAQTGKDYEDTISRVVSPILGHLIVFTVRSKKEGGEFSGSKVLKESVFLEFLPWIDVLDIEISELPKYTALISVAKKEKKCILGSFHDFKSVPFVDKVKRLISRAQDFGADIVKIAGTTNTKEELASLLKIQLELGNIIPLTIMGMGSFALLSRVLLSNFGSIWTYGALGKPTAPNQPTCRKIYELSKMFFG